MPEALDQSAVVVILRQTFRCHDNPLLSEAFRRARKGKVGVDIHWIVDHDYVPRYKTEGDRRVADKALSYHQWHLLLHCVQRHVGDLVRLGLAPTTFTLSVKPPTDSWAACVRSITRSAVHIMTDTVYDPFFDNMTAALRAAGASFYPTRTLNADDRLQQVAAGIKAFSPPSHRFADLQAQIRSLEPPLRGASKGGSGADRSAGATQTSLKWIRDEISRVTQLRTPSADQPSSDDTLDLYPFDRMFGAATETGPSFDDCILSMSRKAADLISDPRWRKPKTKADLQWGQIVPDAGQPSRTLNTSQMSPWLAVGALGVRQFYEDVVRSSQRAAGDQPARDFDAATNDGQNKRHRGRRRKRSRSQGKRKGAIGTGVDQLLFREVYYAVAASARPEDDFWANARGWWAPTREYVFKGAAPSLDAESALVWREAPKDIWQWARGRGKRQGLPDAADVNVAARQLRKQGWIHHLQRHLMMDQLCNATTNGMHRHWLWGERWFAATEVDYDAVSNRANAMWLAAVAFSTKQSPRSPWHYGETFISDRHHFTDSVEARRQPCDVLT